VPAQRLTTPPKAVLFDLDGTLIDSAPDLAGAANDMRAARGLAPHPLAHFRPMVGSGARGMVLRAFGLTPEDDAYASMRDEFLQRYEARMTRETLVFDGMHRVLAALEAARVPWGIVTNKATRYTVPLVAALGLAPRAATVVCGDTTPHPKPHPEPLREAARRLGLPAEECVYVGDDERDVIAGRAAGMATVAVHWGYLGEGAAIEGWGADQRAATPPDLLKLWRMA
jgi:phosphoglycolate phosphatase